MCAIRLIKNIYLQASLVQKVKNQTHWIASTGFIHKVGISNLNVTYKYMEP